MKTLIIISVILLLAVEGFSKSPAENNKYDKWLTPSYFRGYNVLYIPPKTLQDFIDFSNYGGNLFSINLSGFLKEDPPYDTVIANIAATDQLVSYCRQAGVHYVMAVRSGPGAYDTYLESIGLTGESRIWNTGNTVEQQLYANMLKMIVNRYRDDT